MLKYGSFRQSRGAIVHHSGISFSRRECAAHELSFAALDVAGAGVRLCRARKCAGRLPPCRGSGLPFLQLRGLHADWLKQEAKTLQEAAAIRESKRIADFWSNGRN